MVMFSDGDERDNLYPIITISVGSVDNAEAARIVRPMPGSQGGARGSYVRMRYHERMSGESRRESIIGSQRTGNEMGLCQMFATDYIM